jgi:hypothetical protein
VDTKAAGLITGCCHYPSGLRTTTHYYWQLKQLWVIPLLNRSIESVEINMDDFTHGKDN